MASGPSGADVLTVRDSAVKRVDALRHAEAVAPRATEYAAPSTAWGLVDGLLAVTLLAGVAVVANLGRMPEGVGEFLTFRISVKNVFLMLGFAIAWPAVLRGCGLYSPARLRQGRGEWPRLIVASLVAGALAMAFPLTSRSHSVRPIHVLIFAALLAPASAAIRGGVRAIRRAQRAATPRRLVLVGSGSLAARMHQAVASDPLRRSEIVGFVDGEAQMALALEGVRHLGTVEDLDQILMHQVVDEVLIGLPIKSGYEQIQRTIATCERVGVPAKYPTDLFRTRLQAPRFELGEDAPVMALDVAPSDARLVFKRAMDVVGAGVLLVALSPVFLVVAVMVKLTSPGPVLFVQERYGYMKRRFRMLKFRTMVEDAEHQQAALELRNEAKGPVFKIRDDPRKTRIGTFLRRSSLDELPQLWHVLTGEMSLVGPRPLPVRDVGRFEEPWLMRRFSVRPGLTCLWQISGRSDLGFDRWVTLDLQYIDRWSLQLDLAILIKTIPAIVRGAGAR
jgi:exopolysaccharide biosynthesis polyprenyl glycosylphosphotransferase